MSTSRARKPQVRSPAVAVPKVVLPAVELAAIRDALADLDRRRSTLLLRRDALVVVLRAEGATWPDLERLAGCSRPAMLKRGAV